MDRENETVRLSGQPDVELRTIIDQQVLKTAAEAADSPPR